MADRLIRVIVPDAEAGRVDRIVAAQDDARAFRYELPGPDSSYEILLPAESVESVLDPLHEQLGHLADFRAAVLPVETTIPRRADSAPALGADAGAAGTADAAAPRRRARRISREELYDDLADLCRPTATYLVLVVASSVVATIGVARDDVAVLIGAMVIAPLLGPNVALALASTLGDRRLAGRALLANGLGVATAFAVAVLASLLLDLDPDAGLARSRARLEFADLALALAAGTAGALAFTSGVPASLVGVMVAVALLPPLAVCALHATAARWDAATGAALLLSANVVCVNLAGIAAFLVQGIAPRAGWKKRASRRVAARMLLLWTVLLAALVVIVQISRRAA